MRERAANSVNPPASAITSSTVVRLFSSNCPAFFTSPSTETLKLWTSLTMTDTSGVGMYSASFFASASRSCIGVRPAACTSLRSGSEIFPSGRTGTARLMAVLFHTATSRRSSGPIL